jgi:hypothetical protein
MSRSDVEVTEARASILSKEEVDRRQVLLAVVQAELGRLGVHAVQARHRRLALSGASLGAGPSGLTDPVLHAFSGGGTRKVTTDGAWFRLDDGAVFPVADAAAAAAVIAAGPA